MPLRGAIASILAAGSVALGGCGAAPGPSARALFGQACGACHSLSATDDPRRQGGDLLRFRSSRTQLLQFASEMPVRRALSPAQLQAVVDFLREVERRAS
ncbi:MAG: hypothetical protein ACR2NR_15905 [Solirubrobacteraceae bacterium]